MGYEHRENIGSPPYDPAGARTEDNEPHSGAGIGDIARAQADAAWSGTKQKARHALDEQRQEAAAGVGEIAGALHKAAEDLGGKNRKGVADLAERTAEGLERLSSTLRTKDLDVMVRDVESFARRQPALFLGAAVAAGFLAGRFLKSSSVHDRAESHSERSTTLVPTPSPEVATRADAVPDPNSERRT